MRRGVTRAKRRGQSLLEFALAALATYLLLAAILTFGHLLYVAQVTQSAADVAARELSRTPLPANITFNDALDHPEVRQRVFDEDYLVVDLDALEASGMTLLDHVGDWPIVNQQLFPAMILDLVDTDGGPRRWLRYPGALEDKPDAAAPFNPGKTVWVPLIVDGMIVRREVLEEIRPSDPGAISPFHISSDQMGIAAVRINYPFQAAAMSGYVDATPNDPFDPNIGNPDNSFIEPDQPFGTHTGEFGLGRQAAMGSEEMTQGLGTRPFRRVISSQAIFRREVFSE
jgi:hypothetical protein